MAFTNTGTKKPLFGQEDFFSPGNQPGSVMSPKPSPMQEPGNQTPPYFVQDDGGNKPGAPAFTPAGSEPKPQQAPVGQMETPSAPYGGVTAGARSWFQPTGTGEKLSGSENQQFQANQAGGGSVADFQAKYGTTDMVDTPQGKQSRWFAEYQKANQAQTDDALTNKYLSQRSSPEELNRLKIGADGTPEGMSIFDMNAVRAGATPTDPGVGNYFDMLKGNAFRGENMPQQDFMTGKPLGDVPVGLGGANPDGTLPNGLPNNPQQQLTSLVPGNEGGKLTPEELSNVGNSEGFYRDPEVFKKLFGTTAQDRGLPQQGVDYDARMSPEQWLETPEGKQWQANKSMKKSGQSLVEQMAGTSGIKPGSSGASTMTPQSEATVSSGTNTQGQKPGLQRLFDFLKGDLTRQRDKDVSNSRVNAASRGVFYGTPGTQEETDINEQYGRGLGQLDAELINRETDNELRRLQLASSLIPQDITESSGLDPNIFSQFGSLLSGKSGSNKAASPIGPKAPTVPLSQTPSNTTGPGAKKITAKVPVSNIGNKKIPLGKY